MAQSVIQFVSEALEVSLTTTTDKNGKQSETEKALLALGGQKLSLGRVNGDVDFERARDIWFVPGRKYNVMIDLVPIEEKKDDALEG